MPVLRSADLAAARLMDEGSSFRSMKLHRRNDLAEDGARRTVKERESARQGYPSEIENAVRHIQEQHRNAEEVAQQFKD